MSISWSTRRVGIEGSDFTPRDVEAPDTWSDRAVEQVARLYFRGSGESRETSVAQLVGRVTSALREHWSKKLSPNVSAEHAKHIERMVLEQKMAFNTPVWVNLGYNKSPQCSACFIQSVDDSMDSITDLQKSETMLFRAGSGTGTNLSTLRPRNWPLSGGGSSSGPVSFAMGYDAWAGVTKSGGSSRRAAKMVVLNVDHPDILDFINSKVTAQKMIRDLIAAGWDSHFDAPATAWARYQNANHSVRVTDEFMEAVHQGRSWDLKWGDKVVKTVDARELWERIVEAAWDVADPGLQFDTQINYMHTCKVSARINASNPCSEYMFLDDSACNLASLNLVKYFASAESFLVEEAISRFRADVDVTLRSMDAIVDISSYPTEKITKNSHDFRPLGLGYANLGALLMRQGLAYDSEEGREYAACITALMMAQCMHTSAKLAWEHGPFPKYAENKESVLSVMRIHLDSMKVLLARNPNRRWSLLAEEAVRVASDALVMIESHGMRNAQLTLLAPTGTIAFMMDCDTTGIEPEAALVKIKNLAGGGSVKLINNSIDAALIRLGYNPMQRVSIIAKMKATGEVEVLEKDRSVFATAFGSNRIAPEAHVLMVAAVQPFLSGAVSKTVNLPADATTEDVSMLYALAWKKGLKAVSLYRDGSKGMQPLKAVNKESTEAPSENKRELTVEMVPRANEEGLRWGDRKHMPNERSADIMKVTFTDGDGGERDFYCKVGKWPGDGIGEIWFESDGAAGSLLSGVLKLMGLGFSLALQHGAPLPKLVEKMRRSNFPPNGFTRDPNFPIATSFADFFAQWIEKRYLTEPVLIPPDLGDPKGNARTCSCGGTMYPDGTCWRCVSCGTSSGSCGG